MAESYKYYLPLLVSETVSSFHNHLVHTRAHLHQTLPVTSQIQYYINYTINIWLLSQLVSAFWMGNNKWRWWM